MHMVLAMGLLACSFLQSFSAPPWIAAHSEAYAFAAILVLGWEGFRKSHASCAVSSPLLLFGSFGLLALIQFSTGLIVFGGDVVVLLLYFQLSIAAILIAQSTDDLTRLTTVLALTLIAAAVLSVVVALCQSLLVWTHSPWILLTGGYRRSGANIGQPNHMATLLVMAAASLIYLNHRLGLSRPFGFVIWLLLLVGMGTTESRAGLLSGLALCVWWYVGRTQLKDAPRGLCMLAAAVAIVVMMWGWPSLIRQAHEFGASSKVVAIDTSAGMRMVVWPQLMEAVWQRPWLGWGIRGVSTAHASVLPAYSVSEPYTYAHNIILELAIGIGLPLTVLVLTAVGIWVFRRLKGVRSDEEWFAVGLLVPFAVHSMLEYPFAYAYLLVPAMFAVGILERRHTVSQTVIFSNTLVGAGFLMFMVMTAWVGVEYVAVEEDFRVARFESLRVGNTPENYERPNVVLLTQMDALLIAMRSKPEAGMSERQVENLRNASLRFPWPSIQSRYALSLALNGEEEAAVRQLKIIRSLHGERVYAKIRRDWCALAKVEYPQLQLIALP